MRCYTIGCVCALLGIAAPALSAWAETSVFQVEVEARFLQVDAERIAELARTKDDAFVSLADLRQLQKQGKTRLLFAPKLMGADRVVKDEDKIAEPPVRDDVKSAPQP